MLMRRHWCFLKRYWLNVRRLQKLPLLNRTGEENKIENLWDEIKTGRSAPSYRLRQNRLFERVI